jgi:hypothetical protein
MSLFSQSVQRSILSLAAWEILVPPDMTACCCSTLHQQALTSDRLVRLNLDHIGIVLDLAALRAASRCSIVARSLRLCLRLHTRQQAGHAHLTAVSR